MDKVLAEPGALGSCPFCGKHDGLLNVGASHTFVCHEHRVKWGVGCNLFDTWKTEDPETWRRNNALLATYETVEPLMPPRPPISSRDEASEPGEVAE